jgi:type IV secretory pathway VirB4 component
MISKIDKSLDILTKRRRRTQTNKIRDEKGNITKYTNEIQMTVKEYFKNLHSNKQENLDEMDKCLESYDLLNWPKRI